MGKFYEGVADALALYVRQLAWLNTAPEPENPGSGQRPEPVTRLTAKQQAGQAIHLPPNPADYLTDWLFEIGPSAGDRALGYHDFAAWQAISGVELDPWEAKVLRRLSNEYLGQVAKARKASCQAPYSGTIEEARDKVTAQFAAMVKAMKNRGSQGARAGKPL